MHLTSQRIALLGLAVGPSLMTFWMTIVDTPQPVIQNSAPFAVVSSVLAAISVWIYGTFPENGNLFASDRRERPARLLKPSSFRKLPENLPDRRTMLSVLTRAMTPPQRKSGGSLIAKEPERPETVVQMSLLQVLQSWAVSDIRQLEHEQLIELYLLHELMHLGPVEAGKMAPIFLKPDNVLLIHEQISALREQRRVFDEELAAFESTMDLWNRLMERRGMMLDLRGRLESMPNPDADLWHHLIAGYDPSNPEQREASLWAASQPQCHRATVAVFLWKSIMHGYAEAATKGRRAVYDQDFLDGVRRIIRKWNHGHYKNDGIGLDPEDMLCRGEEAFREKLDVLSDLQKSHAWPMPQNMFRPFPGRPAADRKNWCFAQGRPVVQPKVADYVQYLRLKSV